MLKQYMQDFKKSLAICLHYVQIRNKNIIQNEKKR